MNNQSWVSARTAEKRKPEIGNLFMGSDKRPTASYDRSPKKWSVD